MCRKSKVIEAPAPRKIMENKTDYMKTLKKGMGFALSHLQANNNKVLGRFE